ncbi:mannosyltransferase [Gramella jeungdoensis]|uniref:Mannosyltransferase n=1 Tax=Gramella jeungdoensis TaxID=708091 RepID=A0ABT0Z595_9FLAO|nr:mannosyltransferase [Gramella jeungdoensis]MCM8570890.1 mannosyltransferase [Gramella jeungdoensis]
MDFRKLKLYQTPIIFSIGCIAFYLSFAYDLDRSDFIKLIGLYGALFFMSFKLIQVQKNNFWILVSLALIFRLLFMVAIPNLSQDYFRFIWDGRLLANGWNPYEYIPAELIRSPDFIIAQSRELFHGMGSLSGGNFTNYAPINQFIFAIAGWLAPSSVLFSVILLRIVIILADFGTLYFGTKLLRAMRLPDHRIFWYILNPFIIIELTGNLHFEGVMVFFLVWSLYLLHKKKWLWSAVLFGLSVSVKLLPLMFLPLFFRYFKTSAPLSQAKENHSETRLSDAKKSHPKPSIRIEGFWKLIIYYLLVFAVVIISFLPFFSSGVIQNFTQSIGLWFGKFEFNASIYYIVRWIGYQVKGYNIIGTAGVVLPFITFLIIMALSLFRKNNNTQQLITSMLFAITAYLFLSTTVHPWYLTIALVLSVFTQFRYVIAWTAVVFLSYFAYSNTEYQENLWFITAEYLLVFGYLIWEMFLKKKGNSAFFRV